MLFREEAVKSNRRRLTGSVVITQSVSTYTVLLFVTLFFLSFAVFLSSAEIARKETVKGFLVPDKGLVKVYPGRTGILDALYIKAGDRVEKGAAIAKIVNSEKLVNGLEYANAMKQQIRQQVAAIEEELQVSEVIFQQELASLRIQRSEARDSLASLKKVKATSAKRLAIKKTQLTNQQTLHAKGFLSDARYAEFEERYLELLGADEKIEQQLCERQMELSRIDTQIERLPADRKLVEVTKKREIAGLQSNLYQVSNQTALIRSAPESGYVTAIQPTIGARVNSQSPLLSIIPNGSRLDIELFLPTKSAGFIKVGDKVKVRIEAFPYQKFGMLDGVITRIDQSLILPDEKQAPVYITEPVYRVKARLNQQAMMAFGQRFPLKVGMLADADIILESRSILEWILEPLLAIKGTLPERT
ncbi:HlyD family efflux transporter periplasmic adaptor subunit [Vibrio ouci]|uniref:HlyD family efflux transporter periplasmic adaptor subunit n=1 Tax=Vibrio ouci TaxID=2499078 RepID=A0A4Y8WAM1_9VIBR|nr:HlyD family efflux transporter periplasmic adaptor subunit [Vibrio ouci]TFH89438.1 HlyD family efflux transporter periplasmic adaptor subunit [Vibrio ouci]